MIRNRAIVATALVLSTVFWTACGQDEVEQAPGVLVVEPEGQLPEPPAEPVLEQPSAETPPVVEEEAFEPLELPEPAAATIATDGGEITAGAFRVVIPALEEPVEAQLRPLLAGELWSPQPMSLPLAAAELSPSFTIAERMMELTFPVGPRVEPGETLQLLAYSRSMDAFAVVDENRVSGDRTVTFRTDVFSQYAVVAVPELRQTTCSGAPFELNEREPARDERLVVGQVEREERMNRETALAVLTDMRLVPGAENIIFKNEERRLATEDTPAPHEGEDFLVDPRLAQPLVELGQSVLAQWIDPIGGGPAFQLRVTDSYDAQIEHSVRSNHYRGLAVDLTLSPVPAARRDARQDYYGRLARQAACAGFDFVDFENRFHIHASSAGARLARIEEGPGGRRLMITAVDGLPISEVPLVDDLAIDGRSLVALRFGPEGDSIDIFADHKGTPEAFRVDLGQPSLAVLAVSGSQPAREPSPRIDESLTFLRIDSRYHLSRPPADGEQAAPALPFPLTAEGWRGLAATAWTAHRGSGLGELIP